MPSATPVGLVVLIMFLAFGEGGEDGQGGEEGGELETEYHFINKVKTCLLWEIFYFWSLSWKKYIITIFFVFLCRVCCIVYVYEQCLAQYPDR